MLVRIKPRRRGYRHNSFNLSNTANQSNVKASRVYRTSSTLNQSGVVTQVVFLPRNVNPLQAGSRLLLRLPSPPPPSQLSLQPFQHLVDQSVAVIPAHVLPLLLKEKATTNPVLVLPLRLSANNRRALQLRWHPPSNSHQ